MTTGNITTVGGVRVVIDGDNIPLNRALRKAQAKMKVFERNANRIASRMRSFGLPAAVGLGGLGLAAAKASRSFVKFETSLSRIVGLVGVGAKDVERMGEEIKRLGPEISRSPVELAEALFFVTSAGFRGAEAMDVLTQAGKAASAGLGDTVPVADAVTSAINAYGQANLDAGTATGILVAAVREGKLDAASLAPVLGRLLPLASELGVEFHEVAAGLASLSRTGLNASEAMTALRGVLQVLQKPSRIAEKDFLAAGISIEHVQKVLREDGLLATLKLLQDSVDGNKRALAQLFPNIEGLVGVFGLVGENASATDGIFKALAKTTVEDLNYAAGVAAQTTEDKLNAALADLETIGINLAAKVLPDVVDALKDVISLGNSTTTALQKLNVLPATLRGLVAPLVISREFAQGRQAEPFIPEEITAKQFGELPPAQPPPAAGGGDDEDDKLASGFLVRQQKRIKKAYEAALRSTQEGEEKLRAEVAASLEQQLLTVKEARTERLITQAEAEESEARLRAAAAEKVKRGILEIKEAEAEAADQKRRAYEDAVISTLDGEERITAEVARGLASRQAAIEEAREAGIISAEQAAQDLEELEASANERRAQRVADYRAREMEAERRAVEEKIALDQRYQDFRSSIIEGREGELARLQDWYSRQVVLADEFRLQQELSEEQHQANIAAIVDRWNSKRNAIEAKYQTDRQKFAKKSTGEQTKQVFGELSNLLGGIQTNSKKVFKVQKAAAIANAVINTYTGITKTLATYPWPIAGVLAAAHAAAGFAKVQAISSQQFGGSRSVDTSVGGGSAAAATQGGNLAGTPVGNELGAGEQRRVDVRISVEDDVLLSGAQVRSLIDQINEQIGDGAVLGSVRVG